MKHRLPHLPRLRFALGLLLAAGLGLTQFGCSGTPMPVFGSTPVYSTQERYALISRNINLELQMMNDDVDTVLLLRPESGLTYWNMP